MTVAVSDLFEVTDNYDPGSVNMSLKGGRAKVSYYFTPTSVDDFSALATLILGSAVPDGLGGIARTPPLGHPRFPALYAESISDFAGIGGNYIYDTSAPAINVPNIPNYARYPTYKVDIEFSNRHYALISDAERGSVTSGAWNDDNGSGTNVSLSYLDTKEYLRWVWITSGPKENILTAKQGQMVMDVAGVPVIFPDMPKMPLPDGFVKISWFEVPYSFVRPSSGGPSYFQLYQGRVNQFQFLNWAPGELLYMTIQVKPYNSPLPVGGALVSLCDIDILCLETSRLLAPMDPIPSPALANWIPAGFNLQPFWRDKMFHYAYTGTLAGAPADQAIPANQQRPSWLSFPFQILFSDPNVAP